MPDSNTDENAVQASALPTENPSFYGSLLTKIREEDKSATHELLKDAAYPGYPRSAAQKRVHQELRRFHEDETHPYISVAPIDGSWKHCLACIEGTPNSAYGGGVFWLQIKYPADYPFKPLSIEFITPIFHPNIDSDGHIWLDILDENWSIVMDVEMVLLSVLSILGSPCLDGPSLYSEIADIYINDYESYYEMARIHTEAFTCKERPDEFDLETVIFTPPETVVSSQPNSRPGTPEPLSFSTPFSIESSD
ncbi:hypothetical protein G7Y89_g7263 [Cudoniella acicularis]|uniref:UBC core domain-containing protein n=1 Tax=Cudoniella acicularis TaxID=354080 RepID=A0A8H4W1P9_9HELO|nr:hypothetical protein G7Y89_g7263 [Cudoniella acicularis]